MIGKIIKGCSAAIAVFSVCTAVYAADLVDNPRYQEWSKYKPGTFIKMDVFTEQGGQNIKSTMTTALKEVTPEKVVLEVKTEISIAGMPSNENVMPITEPAKIEESKIKPSSPELMPNCKVVNKGKEDLKVGDKTYKCNWYEMEIDQQGMKIKSKCWTCDDVLDKIVKNEIKMDFGSTTTMLVEFKAVK